MEREVIETPIIGVASTGPRAGKDTYARMLQSHSGHIPVAYADPLKAMLKTLLTYAGVPHPEIEEIINGDKKSLPLDLFNGHSGRTLMQTLGTEWGRQMVDAELWTRLMERRAKSLVKAGMAVVITDVRFPEERDHVKAMGGLMVYIDNPRVERTDHQSEGRILPHTCDLVVPNLGDMEEFTASAYESFGLLKGLTA